MITNNQLNSLNDEELCYLYTCFNDEWNSLNMGYPFKFEYIKYWRNVAVQPVLVKYQHTLTDEYKGIIMQILNKLEENHG